MSRDRVLALLRERPGEYLSGEAMSRTLGISRAGVWKAIEGLRQEGYVVASAPNRGYRLGAHLRVGQQAEQLPHPQPVGGVLQPVDRKSVV